MQLEFSLSAAIVMGALLLQMVAAVLALRLIAITGRIRAWTLIAVGLVLLGFLRVHLLYRILIGEATLPPTYQVELQALAISLCFVAGIYMIGPVFRRMQVNAEELRNSRAILYSVLENAPVGVAVRDTEGTFQLANKAYRDALKIDGDVAGRHARDLLPPELADDSLMHDREIIERGASETYEKDGFGLSDEGRMIVVRFPVRDDTGQIVGVGRAGLDITELQHARQQLAVQQERYERAMAAGRIGVWEWDLETDEKYVSENWEVLAGCPPGTHISTMSEWIELVDPAAHETTRARLDAYRSEPKETVVEYHVRFKNGNAFWWESRVTPRFDENGVARQLIGIDTDITERKQAEADIRDSEALLASIIENLPVGIVIKDQDHVVELPNRTYLQWYGTDAEEMIGRRSDEVEAFLTEDDAARMNSQEDQVLSTGATFERETERRFVDGNMHTVNIKKFPIYDQAGVIVKVGSVSVDLTEQIAAQKALKEANDRLEAANRAKSDFLAHMSHELRTPLNSVIGFSQIMSEEHMGAMNNPTYLEYATLIRTSAEHLLNVINDILDISKVEAGELTLSSDTIDVRKCFEMVYEFVQLRMQAKSQRIEIDVPENFPGLCADDRLIRQILMNLLSNATKFTPNEGYIAMRARLDEQKGIVLLVEDSGIGMDVQDIPRALEPFGQLRRSPDLTHDGTGLGLSLTSKFLELHDAEMQISSAVGEGLTVVCTFPPERTIGG